MLRSILLGMLLLSLAAALVLHPGDSFQAALQGLTIWWEIVFPGLLPFYVLSELLFALGAIHALGVLLDPLMRTAFRLPGDAGWAVALGWTAGFPSGAEAAARLKRDGRLSTPEAQRLMALSHMPSPVLMLIVIGAGFMNRPALGAAVAASVWLSGLLLGFLMARFTPQIATSKRPEGTGGGTGGGSARHRSLPSRVRAAMEEARKRDGRGLGKALGDAVATGVQRLMAVGGFMIAGSVLIRLLKLGLPEVLRPLSYAGIYEAHLGAFAAGRVLQSYGLPLTAAALAALLGWSGWSALLGAQSAASGAGLKLGPFVTARLLHAALAFAVALPLAKPIVSLLERIVPALSGAYFPAEPVFRTADGGAIQAEGLRFLWAVAPVTFALLLAFLAAAALLSIALSQNNPKK